MKTKVLKYAQCLVFSFNIYSKRKKIDVNGDSKLFNGFSSLVLDCECECSFFFDFEAQKTYKIYQRISDERIRFECSCVLPFSLSLHLSSLLFISVLALERFKSAYIVQVPAPSTIFAYYCISCLCVFFRFGFWNI